MNTLKYRDIDWNKLAGWLLYLVLAAGMAVRALVWLQNRSLFIDEANLARNFYEKGLPDLFRPLAYDQFAPPFFSVIQKCSVLCLGHQEYALRLFPMLCGLASVALFYWIARRLITNPWVLLGVCWIFCFSDIFIRYATEAKQYSSDLAVALGLVALCLQYAERPFRAWWAAVIGGLVFWLSMPAVFVLFGVGIFFLYRAWQERKQQELLSVVLVLLVWGISFSVYYWFMLRPSLETAPLVNYHKPWFFPLIPLSAAEWKQAGTLLLTFPYYTAGYTVVAKLTGGLGILTGLGYLLWKRKSVGLLIAVPVLACILASGFEHYSLIPRMLVWAFPLVLLVQGMGWQQWWDASGQYLRPLCLLLWIATAALFSGGQYLVKPFTIEEIRPVLDVLRSEFREGDKLYVSHEARPAVAYYRNCHVEAAQYAFGGQVLHASWNERPTVEKLFQTAEKPARVWLVYSHVISEVSGQAMQADLKALEGFAKQKRKIEMPGAFGFLYEAKANGQ